VEGVYKIINKTAFHAIDALGYALMAIPMLAWTDEQIVRAQTQEPVDELERVHRENETKRRQRAENLRALDEGTALESAVQTISAAAFLGEDDFREELGFHNYVAGYGDDDL
jgi:hypothetical protein